MNGRTFSQNPNKQGKKPLPPREAHKHLFFLKFECDMHTVLLKTRL